MKFIINTNYESAGTTVLRGVEKRLKASGYIVKNNQWNNYEEYDVVIFMAPDSKIREVKKTNQKIVCGLFDPKATHSWQIQEARAADFLIVSSIEQREFFIQYNENIFIYYMFPDVPEITKKHIKKDKIIIGYHGNKQHLDAMELVSQALDRIAKKYDIELWAIYNIEKLGRWKRNIPKKCRVRHIQWTSEDLVDQLSHCDIGIVPALHPTSWLGKLLTRPIRSYIPFLNFEGFNRNDYLQRFKYSNNPGRIYVFSQVSIPVVADFTPSTCQIIEDGVSGLLAGTSQGWEYALTQLIEHVEHRNTFSYNLYSKLAHSPDNNFKKFTVFIKKLYANK